MTRSRRRAQKSRAGAAVVPRTLPPPVRGCPTRSGDGKRERGGGPARETGAVSSGPVGREVAWSNRGVGSVDPGRLPGRGRRPRRRPHDLAARAGDGPHRAPVLVAAPAVVAQALAHEASTLPGIRSRPTGPLTPWPPTGRSATVRRSPPSPSTCPRPTTSCSSTAARDPALNQAVVDRITAIEEARDRTVEVRELTCPGTSGAETAIRTLRCSAVSSASASCSPSRWSVARWPPPRRPASAGCCRWPPCPLVGAGVLQLVPAVRLPGDLLPWPRSGRATPSPSARSPWRSRRWPAGRPRDRRGDVLRAGDAAAHRHQPVPAPCLRGPRSRRS